MTGRDMVWDELGRRAARLAVELVDLDAEITRLEALRAEKREALAAACREANALHEEEHGEPGEPSHDDVAREALWGWQAEETRSW